MRTLLALGLASASFLSVVAPGASRAADDPVHQVVVSGPSSTPVSTWPAFAEGVDRFAVRSTAPVDTLTVTASSTDPGATVRVNGRPVANGATSTVAGLTTGDEVNVQVTDSSGTSNQSWILLPPDFPTLTATGPHPDLAEGLVLLTLGSFVGQPFSAIVDANAVPVRATSENLSDLKRAASDPGHFSAAVVAPGGGYRIVELDERFRELRSLQLAGAPADTTDFHDSVLLPDGGAVLLGYWPVTRDGTDWVDAVIEVQDATGAPTLTWNSKDHVDEATEGLVPRSAADYAHINSVQRLANGDIVASFRNLSQVMLIAGSDHDGHATGDVIWRFGGMRNDFDIIDDPYAGPCAQHAATILANGHLMVFDNGARRDEAGPIAPQTADMCPDPGDPDGPRVARPQSRVTEYELDTTTVPPTARLVWSHEPQGRYAPFAGNAQPLPGGNVLAGWSQAEAPTGETAPVATEVTRDGREIWSVSADHHFSYRAFKYPVADRTPPTVQVDAPADGSTVRQGDPLVARFGCADTGGSNLDRCSGSVPPGSDLSAQVGTHQLTVTATDREGNTTSRIVTYTVTPTTVPPPPPPPSPTSASGPRPDAMIRKPGAAWKGRGVQGTEGQRITFRTRAPRRLVSKVKIVNAGDSAGRLVLEGSPGNAWSTARWIAGRREVTGRVTRGTYRTPVLAPGASVRLRLVLRVHDTSGPHRRTVRLSAAAASAPGTRDVVRARIVVGD